MHGFESVADSDTACLQRHLLHVDLPEALNAPQDCGPSSTARRGHERGTCVRTNDRSWSGSVTENREAGGQLASRLQVVPVPVSMLSASSRIGICISPARGFKQLDGVACRVVEQDLLAAHAGDNLVSEMGSRLAQRLDFAREVVDLELYAVPAAWLGLATIGHGLGGTPGTEGRVQQEAEVASRDDCEAGGGPELDAEAETLRVEGDCRIHIIDYVTHGDWSHGELSCFLAVLSQLYNEQHQRRRAAPAAACCCYPACTRVTTCCNSNSTC